MRRRRHPKDELLASQAFGIAVDRLTLLRTALVPRRPEPYATIMLRQGGASNCRLTTVTVGNAVMVSDLAG